MDAALQDSILSRRKLACRKNAANLLLLELPYSDPPMEDVWFFYINWFKVLSLIIYFSISVFHH
jgi:hypothetical protein